MNKSSTCAVVALALGLALGGCSKKDKDKAADPGAACEPAIKKAVANLPGGGGQAEPIQQRLVATLTKLCTEDKWPAEVVQCYDGAKSMQDMKTCRSKLPPELANKAQAEIQRTMMLGPAMGGGMGGPHGGAAPTVPMPSGSAPAPAPAPAPEGTAPAAPAPAPAPAGSAK